MIGQTEGALPVSTTDLTAYAMGSFGTGVFATIPSVLLLYFCTETLHIGAGIAGAIMLLPKLWSIFWDPMVGQWSDRSTHRWGRRRPFMAIGIVGMVIAMGMVFGGPILSAGLTIVWTAASYFAFATLYSVFAVPYIAIPAEIAQDQPTLARLVSWRMMMVMIGIIAGASGAPILVSWGGGGREGYRLMSLVIGIACLLIMAAPIVMMRSRDHPARSAARRDRGSNLPFKDIHASLGNADFRGLALSYLLQATAFASFSAITPYIVSRALGRGDGDLGIALGLYLVTTIISVPIWAWAGKRFGLKAALKTAALGYGAGAILIGVIVLLKLDWTVALLGLAFAGIPFAGLQVLPFTIVGEVIRKVGQGNEGRFTGVWTATEKLGLSLGPALVAATLAISGTSDATGIGLFVCIVPPCLAFLSVLVLRSAITGRATQLESAP